MKEMTLREVCQTFGVSRRAVQGYENAKMVAATSRTSRGYLLYDISAQERIQKIKLYQDMGFSIKEIQQIIDGPADVRRSALIARQKLLEKDVKHTNNMLSIIQRMLDEM